MYSEISCVLRQRALVALVVGVLTLFVGGAAARADRVTGTVVGPEGKPIPGAAVIIAGSRKDPLALLLPETARPLASCKTDAKGVFRVDLRPLPAARRRRTDDPVVFGYVVVHASGYALYQGELTRSGAQIPLERAAPVYGMTVDPSGRPIAGLRLSLLFPSAGGTGLANTTGVAAITEARSVRTGADGGFRFDILPAGRAAALRIEDPHYQLNGTVVALRGGGGASQTVRDPAGHRRREPSDTTTGASAATPVRITVYPAAQVQGRVVRADGRPVAGALVQVTGDEETSALALTDAGGSFHIGGLAGRHDTVSVLDLTRAGIAAPQRDITFTTGQVTTLPPFVLTAGAYLQGRVTDIETHRPIRAVSIACRDAQNDGYDGMTDARGRFSIRVLPGVAYQVSAAPTWSGDYYSLSTSSTMVTLPQVGDTKRLDFTLRHSLTIRCRFIDASGHPIRGIAAYLVPPGSDQEQLTFAVLETPLPSSDAHGVLNVGGLSRDGKPLEVVVSPGWAVIAPQTLTPPKDRWLFGPVDIRLRPVSH